ncbi:MAG TPA: sugar phosphate isomerase/epimerase [Burkholderiaceae bacterium]|jgi:inosose dehydratase
MMNGPMLSRRHALSTLGLLAVAGVALPLRARAALAGVRIGYTAMTWGENDRQAIDDIAELGYKGVQFRANVVQSFQPAELRDLLQKKGLAFTALSSGLVDIDADPNGEIERHVANARFVQAAGGQYLQLLDKLGSFGRAFNPAACARLGKLLTEIGSACTALGVSASYHNHLNTLSESPAGLDAVLAASDPRHVKFELDTAHAVAGGANPATLIERYHDRLAFLHLKDLRDLVGESKAKYPFQFVELGRGRVDLASVFAALDKVGFRGWAVVELDRVPDKGGSPKQSAAISKAFLQAHDVVV